jgi:AraC-like DNA-binding protein
MAGLRSIRSILTGLNGLLKMTDTYRTGTIPTFMPEPTLDLPLRLSLLSANGGLFISRGLGSHPRRVIDSFELIYVKRGALSIEEDGVEFVVGPEETLILWPQTPHGGTAPYPADLQFYWAHFALTGGGRGDDGQRLAIPQHAHVARPEQMTNLFRRLLNEQESLGERQIPMSLMLQLMLWEITTSRAVGGALRDSSALLAAKADALIRASFRQPISASTIAAQIGCDPDYLGRVFRNVYRHTLTEAIHKIRIRHATALLCEGFSTVEAVSTQCGFDDIGYFRRVFKRSTGMTPRDYRRIHARVHINTA